MPCHACTISKPFGCLALRFAHGKAFEVQEAQGKATKGF
jgi:hypothetical protein